MSQKLTQIQAQKAEQQLRLSQQQLQLVHLLEMPLAEFEQQVKKELMDNPALEQGDPDGILSERDDASKEDGFGDENAEDGEVGVNDTGEDPYSDAESEGTMDLTAYSDDDLPVYASGGDASRRDGSTLGDGGSFIEYLEGQLLNYDLTDEEARVLRYLIGSLDNRGFIDRSLSALVDELAFKEYLYVTEEFVERMLRVLQSFDPPGIGARSTQECLLLQVDRRMNEEDVSTVRKKLLNLERRVLTDHYDLFLNNNRERLRRQLELSEAQVEALFDDMRRMNVNPGLALNEAPTDRVQTRIPDFIVETDPEGHIEMRLNGGEIPRLYVNRDYLRQLRAARSNPSALSRSEREGLAYMRRRVDAAQMFIESVCQRRRTLYETMRAIIDLQRTFFLTKEEDDKVRLILEDVAARSGYDVSTVSRVCSTKCALLDGRIYPLSAFFKLTRKNAMGEEVDGHKVRELLRHVVETEDKANPLSDDRIVELMKREGVTLARRTVAKYRAEMGIPAMDHRRG